MTQLVETSRVHGIGLTDKSQRKDTTFHNHLGLGKPAAVLMLVGMTADDAYKVNILYLPLH